MTKADVRLEPLYWLLESRALQDKDVVKHFTHTPAPKRTELHDDIQAYIEAERSQHPTTWQQLVIDRLASIFQSRPVLFNRRFRTWLYRLGLMETAVVDNTEWDTASVPDTAELNKILWTAIRWIERLLDGAGLSTVEGLLQSGSCSSHGPLQSCNILSKTDSEIALCRQRRQVEGRQRQSLHQNMEQPFSSGISKGGATGDIGCRSIRRQW